MAKTVDQLTKAVNTKLQTLKLTQGQAITAIGDKAVLSMERIQNALKKKVEEVHDLKTEIQELMFEAEKEEDKIVWQGKEIKERVGMIEKTIDQLDAVIRECKQVETRPCVYCESREVWHYGKSTSVRKGCVSTALVQGTELQSVISLEVVKNVMADTTHQSVIGIPNRCC